MQGLELLDGVIRELEQTLAPLQKQIWQWSPQNVWPSSGENELVMRSEAAYELGAAGLSSVCCSCVTADAALAGEDRVELYGPDLAQITQDTPYARITLLQTRTFDSDDEAYRTAKELELVKYGVFPRGFMIRSSAVSGREQVRVAKSALRQGISFETVGGLFIRKLRENPAVLHARVLFVTDPAVDYAALGALCKKSEQIVQALNHILDGLDLDCAHCEMKPLCDEVEGMKELHRKKLKIAKP